MESLRSAAASAMAWSADGGTGRNCARGRVGRGGGRNGPEGFALETSGRQVRDFLNPCADVSEQTGVVIAIEPLRRAESNIINLVSEGAEWARQIGRPGVRDLGDTYHIGQEGEERKSPRLNPGH